MGKNHQDQFSEERARFTLKSIASLGPRPSGSAQLEHHAFNIIHNRIYAVQGIFNKSEVNRLEYDIQVISKNGDNKKMGFFSDQAGVLI